MTASPKSAAKPRLRKTAPTSTTATAGRGRTSRTKTARAKPKTSPRAKAMAQALMPHEVLLAVARGEVIADHVPTFEERVEAAKAAAPYFAPKPGAAPAKPAARDLLSHEAALDALESLDQALDEEDVSDPAAGGVDG